MTLETVISKYKRRMGAIMKVLFSSYYNHLDHPNGASISTRSPLLALARLRHEVRVFCGVVIENAVFNEEEVLKLVRQLNVPYVVERKKRR